MKTLIVLLLSVSLLATSCSSDDVLTGGEKVAQQIRTVLDANTGIRTASFYVGTSLVQSNVVFSISGQFVTAGQNRSYNLDRLIRYEYGSQGISFYF